MTFVRSRLILMLLEQESLMACPCVVEAGVLYGLSLCCNQQACSNALISLINRVMHKEGREWQQCTVKYLLCVRA